MNSVQQPVNKRSVVDGEQFIVCRRTDLGLRAVESQPTEEKAGLARNTLAAHDFAVGEIQSDSDYVVIHRNDIEWK